MSIYSDMTGDEDMAKLITWYLRHVKFINHELQRAVQAEDVQEARLRCQMLKETGASYGFPILSDVAQTAMTALDASNSTTEALKELTELESVCKRLRLKQA